MIVHIIARDAHGQPTRYRSNPVYTLVDGVRTKVSDGIEGDTLESVVSQVQHAEVSFTT